MPRKNLWIWGTGGHARVVADAIRSSDEFTIIGYINNIHQIRQFAGCPVVSDVRQAALLNEDTAGFVIIGFGDLAGRRRAIAECRDVNMCPAKVVHSAARVLGGARIGAGCFIAANAVVGVDAVVGDHAIVNTAASVDHDCRLAENVHVAPGVRLAGAVQVAEHTLIGIGACVCPGISIGADCVVGAGSVVLHDIPDGTTVFGVPAVPTGGAYQ